MPLVFLVRILVVRGTPSQTTGIIPGGHTGQDAARRLRRAQKLQPACAPRAPPAPPDRRRWRGACWMLASMRWASTGDVLGPVPEVDVVTKRPQGLLNVGTLSARMVVLRSCALGI
jgi:hypothetical protein